MAEPTQTEMQPDQEALLISLDDFIRRDLRSFFIIDGSHDLSQIRRNLEARNVRFLGQFLALSDDNILNIPQRQRPVHGGEAVLNKIKELLLKREIVCGKLAANAPAFGLEEHRITVEISQKHKTAKMAVFPDDAAEAKKMMLAAYDRLMNGNQAAFSLAWPEQIKKQMAKEFRERAEGILESALRNDAFLRDAEKLYAAIRTQVGNNGPQDIEANGPALVLVSWTGKGRSDLGTIFTAVAIDNMQALLRERLRQPAAQALEEAVHAAFAQWTFTPGV